MLCRQDLFPVKIIHSSISAKEHRNDARLVHLKQYEDMNIYSEFSGYLRTIIRIRNHDLVETALNYVFV